MSIIRTMLRPMYNHRRFGPGHRFQIGQAVGEAVFSWKGGAFWEGMKQGGRFPSRKPHNCDAEHETAKRLIHHHHESHIAAATALSEAEDKIKALEATIAKLRRAT